MKYKYGDFTSIQINTFLSKLKKDVFFLLLLVDPKTAHEYTGYDVDAVFLSIFQKLDGANSAMCYPKDLAEVVFLLETALLEYKKDDFEWSRYRKMILDAGNAVEKMKVGV